MLERLGSLDLLNREEHRAEDDSDEESFTPLRLFLAELLLTAGIQATVDLLRDRSTDPELPAAARRGPIRGSLGVAPALLAPIAAAAHASRALRPSDRARTLTRLLDGLVIGVGAAGLTDSILGAARGERRFSFSPLLFGYSGVLSVLLDRKEAALHEEAARLRRRASLVERWVPRRRTRIDRVVVHV